MRGSPCSIIVAYFESIRFSRDYADCFMVNTLTEKHVVAEAAFRSAKRTALRAQRLFLESLQAAADLGELGPERDLEALSKLLTSLDVSLAIYGIVSLSSKDKDAIITQLDTLLR